MVSSWPKVYVIFVRCTTMPLLPSHWQGFVHLVYGAVHKCLPYRDPADQSTPVQVRSRSANAAGGLPGLMQLCGSSASSLGSTDSYRLIKDPIV